MKLTICTFSIFMGMLFGINNLNAQITLNAESGNKAIEQGNCWIFNSITYTNTASFLITGKWTLETEQLNHPTSTACFLKTPWMSMAAGNLTLKYKTDAMPAGTRQIEFFYIPEDATKTNSEGTPVLFSTIIPTDVKTTVVQNISIPIPNAIISQSTHYKIQISFEGKEGSGRILFDDLIIPGTYTSDPSNNCLPKVLKKDADKDGVPDATDQYPNDSYRTFNTYYPAAGNGGTLAFEDSWPSKGDYDFNDLVVNYKINTVTDANNNVVEVLASFVLRASGAGFKNGFGFQLDGIDPAAIISATGFHKSSDTFIQFAANGLEQNQKYATCIVFDNFMNVLTHPGKGTGINTDPTAPTVATKTIDIKLVFQENGKAPNNQYINIKQMPSTLFNFFLIANKERGREIHLANRIPTSLVTASYFNTKDDNSNASYTLSTPFSGKLYKTINNLPWAIDITQGFDYPVEKVSIEKAYLHFLEWAQSSGVSYPDWFEKKDGYFVKSNIYGN